MREDRELDERIRGLFRALPADPDAHPSTKVLIMERVEKYGKRWRFEVVFAEWFFRVSAAALALSICALVYFMPLFLKFRDAKTVAYNSSTAVQAAGQNAPGR